MRSDRLQIEREGSMSIFISHRRADSRHATGRLHDHLTLKLEGEAGVHNLVRRSGPEAGSLWCAAFALTR